MLSTLSEFAKTCGVSRAAVTQAVRKGALVKGDDGKIDDAHPTNRLYLDGKTGKVRKVVPTGVSATPTATKRRGHPAKTEPETVPSADEEDPEAARLDADLAAAVESDDDDLQVQLYKANIAYKRAQRVKIDLETEMKKGNLVERAQMVAVVQGIQKAIDDHLHRLPAKLGPKVYALARKDDGTELAVIRTIETDMGEATRRAIEDVTRAG